MDKVFKILSKIRLNIHESSIHAFWPSTYRDTSHKKEIGFFFFNLDTWATFQENHVRNSNFFRYDWIGEKKYYNSQVHKILYVLWPSIESKGNQTSLLGISLIT